MRFRILIEQDEDGIWVSECPSLPGCISQGKTRKKALENIKDAIKGYIESLDKHHILVLMQARAMIGGSFFQQKIHNNDYSSEDYEFFQKYLNSMISIKKMLKEI